jgi:hypothetical protein
MDIEFRHLQYFVSAGVFNKTARLRLDLRCVTREAWKFR